MKPNKIFLIRHGESEGNVNRNIYSTKPDYKLLLTEKGKLQATEAGKKINNLLGSESLFCYVSPIWRTRETFQLLQKELVSSNIQIREEPRIREQEWGHLRTIEECEKVDKERDEYGTFYFRIPDGESAADVYDRVSDFMGTLHRDFEKESFPNNVLIVTHGMTLRLFIMKWFHLSVEEFELLSNPKNCELIILEKNELEKYNLITEMRKRK
ncbi:MAG: histidine phosphatase family protein [Leptospiraceae bacterium]|nr:histidine phosphatase family protein [Leptospiraceae bacterium]